MGDNPCAEAMRTCKSRLRAKENTYTKKASFTLLTQDRVGKIIFPLALEMEKLENILQRVSTEADIVYTNMPLLNDTYFNEIITSLFLKSIRFLECATENLETKKTTSKFYMFTLSKDGYSKFILTPTFISNLSLFYVSLEISVEDDAISSSPYVTEEEYYSSSFATTIKN